MSNYFETVGDRMPDRMAIYLPSFWTNVNVYKRMAEELESRGQEVISQSHFYDLWQSEFSYVTIPKVGLAFIMFSLLTSTYIICVT